MHQQICISCHGGYCPGEDNTPPALPTHPRASPLTSASVLAEARSLCPRLPSLLSVTPVCSSSSRAQRPSSPSSMSFTLAWRSSWTWRSRSSEPVLCRRKTICSALEFPHSGSSPRSSPLLQVAADQLHFGCRRRVSVHVGERQRGGHSLQGGDTSKGTCLSVPAALYLHPHLRNACKGESTNQQLDKTTIQQIALILVLFCLF